MKKIFSVLLIILVLSASICISGCSKGSSSASVAAGSGESTEEETRRYDHLSPLADSIDLSGVESTISFDSLDLSGTDRIYVQLAYCDPKIYSYWIEDADTISRASDMVKEIKGEDVFLVTGLYELSLCVTFYSGDSKVFYIGVGKDYFEAGSKISDSIEGIAGYMDGYYYSNGTEKVGKELLELLAKPGWLDNR